MADAPPAPDEAEAEAPPEYLARYVRFMDHVADLCTSQSSRIDLRTARSSAELEAPLRMLPHLVREMPAPSAYRQLPYVMAASLYARQTGPARKRDKSPAPRTYNPAHGDMGWSLKRAVAAGVLNADRVGDRLLMMARQEDLPGFFDCLRPLVDQMAAQGVPLSWPRLLRNLDGWRAFRPDIIRHWMTSYYSPTNTTSEED